jgi:hypothetical protein
MTERRLMAPEVCTPDKVIQRVHRATAFIPHDPSQSGPGGTDAPPFASEEIPCAPQRS